ncbi:hypothetical protein B0G73_105155 [Paraburkholderia sp. BL25I1N1]|nr:hypothetical protein B0G73_105155 [Paraburkholderia sp. BL25I1N1]
MSACLACRSDQVLAGLQRLTKRCKQAHFVRLEKQTKSVRTANQNGFCPNRNPFVSHHLLQLLAFSLCQLQIASCKMRHTHC